jgi:hypothetical protein
MRSNSPPGSAHGRDAVATGKVCDQPVADKVIGLRHGPWGYIYAAPPGAARAHISIESLDELPERLTLVRLVGAREMPDLYS